MKIKEYIRYWLKTVALERRRRFYNERLPANNTTDDIYLVSYPKSGNTWLRFLIANAIKIHYGIDREVNFFTIQDIIPGIGKSRNIRAAGLFGRPDLPRILTSHSDYNPYFMRVIFLVRDPRDVIISHYYYAKARKSIPESMKLSQFIRDEKYGPVAWLRHTESWYSPGAASPEQRIVLFKYEDFLKDTYSQLDRLTNLIGIPVTGDSVKRAVELSSKEKMRDSERKHMSTYRVRHQKTAFVRKGKATGGQELDEAGRQYVENITRPAASLLGYGF